MRLCYHRSQQRKKHSHRSRTYKDKAKHLTVSNHRALRGFGLDFKNHSFDEVAIEDIFFAYNPKTVLKLAQFRGALSLKILQIHGDFAEYTPLQVKKAVTGKAKATKEQVAFMVKRLLGLSKDIKPLDITDAIAVALTHAANLRVRV